MILKFNIAEDAELRTYIKDLIKGQVVSILRDDIQNIVTSVLDSAIEPHLSKLNDETYFYQLVKNAIKQKLAEDLKS